MDWPERMQEQEERRVAERRRTGRFTRGGERRVTDRREHSVQR